MCRLKTWASPLHSGLLLISCVVFCSEVEGRPRVIGSSQPVVSTLGDDVILQCRVEPELNVENLTVQWWKPDVRLDPSDPLSDYKYVHCYSENHDEEDMKMSRYAGRTELLTDGLKHGNISLKIRKVQLADQGLYRCQIPQLVSSSIINLTVVKTLTTEHPSVNLQTPDSHDVKGGRHHLIVLISVLIFLLILGGGVVGVLLKCQNQNG